MSFLKISESIRESANKIIDLINAHLDYYQIVAFDKMIFLLTKTVGNVIAGFSVFMVLFFGSFALAEFLGEIFEQISIGYLLVGLLYGIGGFIVWKNKEPWIINPIIAALTETIEDTAHDLGVEKDKLEDEFNGFKSE